MRVTAHIFSFNQMMHFVTQPLLKEAPLMMNPSIGDQVYMCHQYIHTNGLCYILISYKDKFELIHWAHYVRHPDHFIGQYAEGICPSRKDYDILIEDINKHLRDQYPTEKGVRLYKGRIRQTIINDRPPLSEC